MHFYQALKIVPKDDKTQHSTICLCFLEFLLGKSISKVDLHAGFLKSFLSQHLKLLHERTAFQLVASHHIDATTAFLAGAQRSSDLIMHYICESSWASLLKVLSSHKFHDASVALFEDGEVPALIAQASGFPLNLSHLLPGLLRSSSLVDVTSCPRSQTQFIRETFKGAMCESAVHNYFFRLSVTRHSDSGVKLSMLATCSSYLFELQCALRCFSSRSLWLVACSWVYVHLGMYEEAIELALSVDVSLAKRMLDVSEIPLELRKHLWLEVMKHIIGDRSLAISESAHILKNSPVLSIEDALPIFPDFVVVDTFRSEISGCLDEYNHHLKSLQVDATESTIASTGLQSRAMTLNSRKASLAAASSCALSGLPIILGPFIYYPSGHACRDEPLRPRLESLNEKHVQKKRCVLTAPSMISSVDGLLHAPLGSTAWRL